ncbi:hypothetical protein HYS54_03235 [Candidatus Micrarchaeota archaeon]|nr:hypothetical protein [Candidatus Micrarchaeota archaeon]
MGDSYSCTSKNYGDLSIWFLDDEWIYTDGYVRVLVNDYSTSDLFRTSWKKAFGDGRIVVELKEAAKNSTIRWKDGQQTRNSNQVTLVVDCNAKPFPEAVKSASVQQGSTGTVKCNDYTISLDSTQIEPLTKPELANIKVEGSGGVEKRAMLNKGALYFLNNSVFVRVKNILVAPPFVDIEYAC